MISSIAKVIITILFLLGIMVANAVADDFPTILKKLNNIQKQLDNINTAQSHDITKFQTPIPTNQPISNVPVINNNINQQVSLDSNVNPSVASPANGDELIAELLELSRQLQSMVNQPEQQPEPVVKQVDHQNDDSDKLIAKLQEITNRLEAVVDESKNE